MMEMPGTVTLTEQQVEMLLHELGELRDEQGSFDLLVNVGGGIEVSLSGWIEYAERTWNEPSGLCPPETEQVGRRVQLWVFATEYDELEDARMARLIDKESEKRLFRYLQSPSR